MDVDGRSASVPRPVATQRQVRWASGSAWVIAVVCVLGAGPLVVGSRIAAGSYLDAFLQPLLLTLPLVGALIASQRPTNPVGWLLLASGTATALGLLVDGGRIPGAATVTPAAALVSEITYATSLPLLGLAIVLFPDGHPPSGRWRPLASFLAASGGLGAALAVLSPFPTNFYGDLDNPLGMLAGDIVGSISRLISLAAVAGTALAAVSLVVRFTRARQPERVQLQWVLLPLVVGLFGLASVAILELVGHVPAVVDALVFAPFALGVPVGIAVGILRHGLLDIELIVNRTVVYAAVWVVLLLAYAVTVFAAEQVVHLSTPWAPPVLASILLAVAFHPLRTWVQGAVDQRLFGQRGTPYAVVTQLGRQTASSPELGAAADAVVETLATALRLPHVALQLHDGTRSVHGERSSAPVLELALEHAGEDLGHLEISCRSRSDHFSRAEQQQLQELAAQCAIALRAAGAAQQLRVSRRRLIAAVEQERDRLRRELHDGLGAALTGLGFTVHAARNRLDDPTWAASLLEEVSTELGTTQDVVRQLVDDLRPPILDDLGLRTALEQHITRLVHGAGLEFCFRAPPALPNLSPSVEMAAFRIAMEACTNVVRHARATSCTVTLRVDHDVLELEVTDDGCGIVPTMKEGNGTAGMIERSGELGGLVRISSRRAGGTTVVTRLPVDVQ